jgi:di/tricarboxylate transporter
MTPDQIAISFIIILTFSLFIWGKWRYDIVSLIALFILAILDTILGGSNSNLVKDVSQIFSGFGHPAVITVAAVLIISKALQNSGVVDLIAQKIKPFTTNKILHISSLSGVIAILSAFMNNVGALALMLPVTLKTAWAQKRSPSLLLMPIAFASILGGMITMIGTPPNIIISTFRFKEMLNIKTQALLDPTSLAAKYFIDRNINPLDYEPLTFGLFDFSPVGGSIALVGVIFVAFIGWRLIPKSNQKKPESQSLFKIDDYVTEIIISEDSPFIGKTIRLAEDLTSDRLNFIRYINNKGITLLINENETIKEGDQYLVQSDPNDLSDIIDQYKINLAKEIRFRMQSLIKEEPTFVEAVITPDSRLLGRGRSYLRRRTSNQITLIAVARQNKPILKRLGKIEFQVGDVILVQGNEDNLSNCIQTLDLLPLAERELDIGEHSRVPVALFIFSLAIISNIMGILPTTIAFIGAILCYIFTGILRVRDLYKTIDWPIIILLGAMIPVSEALQTTGVTSIISEAIIGVTSALPTWSILSIIMIITMSLSDIINNAATALIMAPISTGIALSMGLSIDPFLMSVAVGASCAFLTPIGHQCNALILGPGGYKFSDYWRMGLPLEILIVVISTPIILKCWPL